MRELYLPLVTTLRLIAWRRRMVALLRILAGCLCAFDACYRWLALQSSGALSLIVYERTARLIALSSAQLHLFVVCIAAAETVIACCLICGAFTNLVCMLAIFLTLFGCIGNAGTGALTMFFGPGYFDLGIMLVAILTFLGLGLGNAGLLYGADRLLVGKLGRWSFLASCPHSSLPSAQRRASDTLSVPTVPTLVTPTLTDTATQSLFVEPETTSYSYRSCAQRAATRFVHVDRS